MPFSPEVARALSGKLSPDVIKSRKQGGSEVSYVEGWHVIAEANRIFGPGGWSSTVETKLVVERARKIGRDKKDGWGVTYNAKVTVTVGDVVREGVGSGHGIDVDLGAAHESAIKEAATDALKRALVTFGWVFGLALYDKSRDMVGFDEEIEPGYEDEPEEAPPRKSSDQEEWDHAMATLKAAIPQGAQAVHLAVKSLDDMVNRWPGSRRDRFDEALVMALQRAAAAEASTKPAGEPEPERKPSGAGRSPPPPPPSNGRTPPPPPPM